MSADYVTLLGSEQVQSAAQTMAQAAHEMTVAASAMNEAMRTLEQILADDRYERSVQGDAQDESGPPCFRGVRGCTVVVEHYHPDEKYARDAS